MFVRVSIALLVAACVAVQGGFILAQEVAEEEAVHTEAEAHGADEHGDAHAASANPLTIDPDLAIVTFLIFLLLLAVLAKFAWRPIMAGLDKREHHVADQLEEAERRNREADEMLKKYQTQLAAASDQVKQMLEDARRSAEATREQELARTQEAVKRERERAVAEIDAAKNRALQEVAGRAADSAIALAGRIVRRELKKDDHAALVSEAIDQFPGGNNN
jgi:F-type H+-transporting ATPase subunit b